MSSDNSSLSFSSWLTEELKKHLHSEGSWILWLDPSGEWQPVIESICTKIGFIWLNGEKSFELGTRHTYYESPQSYRIIRLSVTKEELTWFLAPSLEASFIWEMSLVDALRSYGADITWEKEEELGDALVAHVLTRFDEPMPVWKNISTGDLISETLILEVLSGRYNPASLDKKGTLGAFSRRIVHDYGLPDLNIDQLSSWQTDVKASLLCTETADRYPGIPSPDPHRVIPQGIIRERALTLLRRWREESSLMESFERTTIEADKKTNLESWARKSATLEQVSSSRSLEQVLFSRIISDLEGKTSIRELAEILQSSQQNFSRHAMGFWGKNASKQYFLHWSLLFRLSSVAGVLLSYPEGGYPWKTAKQAIEWYTTDGYLIDTAGESLFEETEDIPSSIRSIREKMQSLYLQITKNLATSFSSLLHQDVHALTYLNTAGEEAKSFLESENLQTAYIFLDAFRFELAKRMEQKLTGLSGSPLNITIIPSRAAIPSITAVGKPHALPVQHTSIAVTIQEDNRKMLTTVEGFGKDVSIAQNWREWFSKNKGVKKFYSIEQIRQGNSIEKPSKSNPIIVIEGQELDQIGTINELQVEGADYLLDRYIQALYQLFSSGWRRIIVVTDHGFIHWKPDSADLETVADHSTILWESRRAIIGRNLAQPNALIFPMSGSDLSVAVPWGTRAFKSYGGLGFFHGGVSLQESVIPVMVIESTEKKTERKVKIAPIDHIDSITPRIQIQAFTAGQTALVSETQSPQEITIKVRIWTAERELVFTHSENQKIKTDNNPIVVTLELSETHPPVTRGSALLITVEDAINEHRLDEREITFMQDIDDWS